MRSLILIFLILVVSIAPVCGLFESTSLQEYIDRYNGNIDQAPGILKSFLGSERVQFEIYLINDSLYQVGLETDYGLVVNTVPVFSDPSILIQTREDVIRGIYNATDPIAAFQEAKESGDVTITDRTVPAMIKLAAVLSSMDVLKFFYSIFFKGV
jgi:hypothetical protein